MTRIEKIRAGIRSVLTSAFASQGIEIDIFDLSESRNADKVPDRYPTVMVGYAGHTTSNEGELSKRTELPIVYKWVLVIAAQNWRTTVAGQNETLGCEELEEMIFDLLRTTRLTTIGQEPVYLVHSDTAPEDFSGIRAGTRAFRQQWQTNELLV